MYANRQHLLNTYCVQLVSFAKGIIRVHARNNLLRIFMLLTVPFYRWENWGSLNNLPKFSQEDINRARDLVPDGVKFYVLFYKVPQNRDQQTMTHGLNPARKLRMVFKFSVHKESFIGTQPCSFIYMLWLLLCFRSIWTEMYSPQSLKYLLSGL